MKAKLLVLMVLASASAFAASRFSIGVNIGGYPGYYPGGYYPRRLLCRSGATPPRRFTMRRPVLVPVSPGIRSLLPGRRALPMESGILARPPYAGAVWVVRPRYAGRRYYNGHWRRR